MEELVKRFADPPGSTVPHEGPAKGGRFMWITPALLFDRCPEVIHGFETLVTLVPTTLRYVSATSDSSHRDSSVSIVTRLRAGRMGFDPQQGLGIFLFTMASSLLSNGYRELFPGGKAAGA
jgi:hypothetical protein